MSKWDKLIVRICNLSKDLRFDELKKVLESYGYVMKCMTGEIIMVFKNYLILHSRMNGAITRRNIDP